ncbi:MAG TPA: alpha/beta hydrolase, partial [Polyangia bacterium]|nr:alpha/beta hydrolase [Polyangia bacterium]
MPDLAKAEKRFDDLVSSAERTLRVGRSRPFFFGPADRPLAGYLHLPEDGWNGTRVLLCPPLGYEALLSYLTLRETAAQLAARTNAMVMHFDYDGSGDSAGTDEDPGRVAAWLASVKHALEYVKAVSPEPGPVVLVGLRAGALLAAHAAAGRTDIAGLALWAPCATGKAFLREQRAFSNLTTSNRPGKEKATAGLDANGFVFTDETMAALEVLRMADLAEPVSPNVLVLQRAEMRTPQAVPKSWTNSVVEEQTTTDYPRMMEPPWLWESPTASISVLADWITRLSPASKTVVSVREGATTATVAPGVRETALFFGKAEHRFGILSAPAESASGEAVLLVTSTFGYRIGPNRMNVAFARRFAAVGTAVLRIDVNGVGDSREGVGTPPPGPYDPAAIDDVCAALVLLKRMGYR